MAHHNSPTLRVARPTSRLSEIVDMYLRGLSMERLGGFDNHEGFDGVMIGFKDRSYHLEFTYEHGCGPERAPSSEHLLVFYESDMEQWQARCSSMVDAGFVKVLPHNPYWERSGQTFRDIDGYLVVIYLQIHG